MLRDPYSERSSVAAYFCIECLEFRLLLAGDFQPGDSNEDFYFDEADVVQTAKFGKFDTGEFASWAEGDWTEDGRYDVADLITAFTGRLYRQGAYDLDAGVALNQLAPLSVAVEPDVTIVYLPENGNVISFAPSGMTALHLVSRSNSFSGNRGSGIFDVASADSQFIFDPSSYSWIEHPGLLPIGWSDQQVLDDLLVDGAQLGGGGLANVVLGVRDDLPTDRPDNALVTRAKNVFVERDEANGILTYDPQTGGILIQALGDGIFSVELVSPDGLFTGAVDAEERYVVNNIDEANAHRFTRVAAELVGDPAPGGRPDVRELSPFTTVYLAGIAKTALTREEFSSSVQPDGSLRPVAALRLALEIGPAFAECENHLANGAMMGDANFDGQFNSQDLVSVFESGEYEDEVQGNSTWSEGDWTCDGEFNTSDLVAAFQTGNYELPAAAVALRRGDDDRELDDLLLAKNNATREPNWLDDQLHAAQELVATAVASVWSRSTNTVDSQRQATDEVMVELETF